jgi:hypothetical protein
MAENKKNIVGFKRFSDLKGKINELDPSSSILPDDGSNIPMNPNLPNNSKREESTASTRELKPRTDGNESKPDEINEKNVETFGKVAKFPKNVKASKAFNFLENVKISKKSIWYIMIESQSDELQMVKYNNREGVDLSKFVNELKSYYIIKNKDNKSICEAISKIGVDGNDTYSKITNISKIRVDDKLLITKITEDLIRLLSK